MRQTDGMGWTLRVSLTGDNARLGEVPAADVARLLLGVRAAVARAGGIALGKRAKATGRWGTLIEQAVEFRLVGLETGSVVGVLELPDAPVEEDQLELDVAGLGEAAVIATLRTALGEMDDADVAGALLRVSEQMGIGTRYDAISFDTDIPGAPPNARIDAETRSRLATAASTSPPPRSEALVGTLFEADFESMSAKLRTPDGARVSVTFDDEQADDVYEALREHSQLIGEVTYDRRSARALSVDLRHITLAEQLRLGLETGDFWADQSIDELRRLHGVEPVEDPASLLAADMTDEEADSWMVAVEA